MRLLAHADSHSVPGLIDELVPGVAAVIDDVLVGFGDPVRQPVVAHELPQILDRVQLRAAGWQRQQRDVGRDDQIVRTVPPGLIEQGNGMSTGRDMEGDLSEVHAPSYVFGPRCCSEA